MLHQTAETHLDKQQSDHVHNAAIEGVSYSVKDLTNEVRVNKMKLLMSTDRQTDREDTDDMETSDIRDHLRVTYVG
jgi:hypothetical protein